ncbi:MAG: cytidylyltransferase domain-containing protein [Dehalococcoidia bacterium]
MSVLCLIPARGGSKNPPNKNILPFKGKPLVVHSVEHGLQARCVERVIVSTDSEKIAEISLQAGAEVPFMRPAKYADDHSTDLEVFRHALGWLAEHEDYRPELIVHLRPTSPLRSSTLIDEGIERILAHPEADSLRTVVVAPHTPYKMWLLNGTYLKPLLGHPIYPESYNMPRQLLPTVYWQNAYLDITRWATVMEKNSMTGDRILPMVMEPGQDVDIDSQRDLERAEEKISDGA